jgi:diadenosine tetraphosphate (Ap4A) HIT family hydrolase
MHDVALKSQGTCAVCNWISRIDGAEKKYFVTELETGFVFLSNKWQYFKGYTFFISKMCVSELHLMPPDFRKTFLFEMTAVCEAVQNAFHAVKINCESLGNSCPHVHWHIIPRYGSDPCPEKAIWNIDREIIESVELTDEELLSAKQKLIAEMKKLKSKYPINAVCR